MLPPEIQRIVLLIALAATSYFMILAWNDDMQLAKKPVEYSDTPLSASAAANSSAANSSAASLSAANSDSPADTSASDIPLIPQASDPTSARQSSDLPDASMLTAGGNDAPLAPRASYTAQELISVVTPTLKVWIDLVGGDIVRVQLPAFPVELDQPDVPFLLLDHTQTHTYIAQSGLISREGPLAGGERLVFTAPSQGDFVVAAGEERELVLTAEIDGAVIYKKFVFRGDDYLLDVNYELVNKTGASLQAAMFAQIKRDTNAPGGAEPFALGPRPYLGAAYTTPEDHYMKVDFEDIDDDGPVDELVEGGWVAFLQHYFLSAWIAPTEQTNHFRGLKSADGTYIFGFTGPLVTVASGATGTWQAQFYAGPKDQKRLEEISENLNLTVDYGFLWWIAVPLFYLLDWLYAAVGNWGVAIILLTVAVKAVLYPLAAAGYRSMANMRRVAPAMKRLQERHAGDREKLSKEMMALYKKEGANPLGGCLPMLLPMPIFIALYWVLFESVGLRQAPFFFWIHDLSVMDPFFILPLLMGSSMYYMQSLNPQVGDPMQVKMMKMMPIMFTVLFLFFPAGLVLYWLVNNLLSIAQQQYVYKKADQAQAAKS